MVARAAGWARAAASCNEQAKMRVAKQRASSGCALMGSSCAAMKQRSMIPSDLHGSIKLRSQAGAAFLQSRLLDKQLAVPMPAALCWTQHGSMQQFCKIKKIGSQQARRITLRTRPSFVRIADSNLAYDDWKAQEYEAHRHEVFPL